MGSHLADGEQGRAGDRDIAHRFAPSHPVSDDPAGSVVPVCV